MPLQLCRQSARHRRRRTAELPQLFRWSNYCQCSGPRDAVQFRQRAHALLARISRHHCRALRWSRFSGPAERLPFSLGARQSSLGTLNDQIALPLRHRRQHGQHELADRRREVELAVLEDDNLNAESRKTLDCRQHTRRTPATVRRKNFGFCMGEKFLTRGPINHTRGRGAFALPPWGWGRRACQAASSAPEGVLRCSSRRAHQGPSGAALATETDHGAGVVHAG